MPIPKITLLYALAKAMKEHAPKVMHVNNINLLTEDLGQALKKQKAALEDPDAGTFETLYDMIGAVAETRVLMHAVAYKLDIDTAGRKPATILQDIIDKTEERNSPAAKEIIETMEWSQKFFSRPEIAELFADETVEIPMPKDLKSLGDTFKSVGKRAGQEASRIHRFLKVAKGTANKPETKEPEAKQNNKRNNNNNGPKTP